MIYDSKGQIVQKSFTELIKTVNNRDMSVYEGYPFIMHPSSLGSMSYKLLRNVYQLSSSVRPAVDSIAREVSTLPWNIINKDGKYHDISEVADIIDFLENPNMDDEDLPSVLGKFITDLLVIGKGVIEKVRNRSGELKELVTRDASLFQPHLNELGFITGYEERDRNNFLPVKIHPKANIIFKYYTPQSYSFGSAPIIETIINEVAVLMLSVKAIGWTFTKDEIPPGILQLGEIGFEALERAKASFEATKGILGQNKLRVVDNVDQVKWIEFTKPFRENQIAELMPMIEKIVAKNFGLSPVDSAQTDVSRGVAESSFKSSQSKLIFPFMEMLRITINRHVVREFDSNTRFIWCRVPQEDFTKVSAGLGLLVDRGIITDNEARMPLGFAPVKGGDTRSVKLGNERVPLDPNTGKPIYRNPVNPGQTVKPAPKKSLDKENELD